MIKKSIHFCNMRLFIAIDLPQNIKAYLFKIQNFLPDDAKMTRTRDFHLTLKFLGSTSGVQKKRVLKILRKMPFRKFTAELEKIGVFLFYGLPRVIHVGVKVPDWLFDMKKKLEVALEPLGFKKENRFIPHLTLARVKETKDPKSFREKAEKITVEPKTFPVESFALFESQLSPSGAVYTKLAIFP